MPKNSTAVRRGRLIREARIARGMKQETVARLVRVSKSALSQWENGDVETIGIERAMNLSTILGLDLADLLPGEIIARIRALATRGDFEESGLDGLSSQAYRLATLWDRIPLEHPMKKIAEQIVEYSAGNPTLPRPQQSAAE